MQLTYTEENYLKAIYNLQQTNAAGEVSVNAIAERMQTKPGTVTDMLRKLSDKKLIHYEKYRKIQLAPEGLALALQIVRKHRLWETFLYDKLHFSWDEVHEVAEQLEHIHSQKLMDRLDEMLGFPQFDPHGDPIPNAQGEMPVSLSIPLTAGVVEERYRLIALQNSSTAFLQQLERLQLSLGTVFSIQERLPFDESLLLYIDGSGTLMVSEKTAANLLVLPLKH